MKGISYITDSHNKKKAVVIELKVIEHHQKEIEDLLDVIVAESRKDDTTVTWEEVKKKLKRKGKL
jgi:quinol monooxygenase YgiN